MVVLYLRENDAVALRIGFTKKPCCDALSSAEPEAFRIIEFAAWLVGPAWLPMAMAFAPWLALPALQPIAIAAWPWLVCAALFPNERACVPCVLMLPVIVRVPLNVVAFPEATVRVFERVVAPVTVKVPVLEVLPKFACPDTSSCPLIRVFPLTSN